ncbi:MAG TPA: hypothetical protein VGM84_13125 [Steroidobacteraceae bacterium]
MSFPPTWTVVDEFNRNASSGEAALREHRNRCLMEAQERAARLQLDREGLRAESKTPTVRIRAWEQFHGLRLPSDAAHPIVDVIATATGLTRAEVESEQHARTASSTLRR